MAAALCYGVRGGGQLAFHITPGSYDTDTLIQVLSELRRFLGGEQATLLWDGAGPADAAPGLLVPAAYRPVGGMTSWLAGPRLP
jgi:hypothetical protein